MEYIMGFDLSLTATAYVILREDRELVDYGLLASKHKGIPRLIDLEGQAQRIVERYCPVLVGIEGYAYGAGNKAHQLGELGGVIRMMLVRLRVPMLIIPPATVKKFATGRGNAAKDEMRLWAYKRWGVEFGTTDEVDAYCIARVVLAHYAGKTGLAQFQREALKGLRIEIVA